MASLNIAQYAPILIAHGFDDLATLNDIRESDLAQMGFLLGHRRKLQRAIASMRGLPETQPLGFVWYFPAKSSLTGINIQTGCSPEEAEKIPAAYVDNTFLDDPAPARK
jgi:hypothetical protein